MRIAFANVDATGIAEMFRRLAALRPLTHLLAKSPQEVGGREPASLATAPPIPSDRQTNDPRPRSPNVRRRRPEERKPPAPTSVMAWVLMAMLIAGLGGFGVTNFGGRSPPSARSARKRSRSTPMPAPCAEINAFPADRPAPDPATGAGLRPRPAGAAGLSPTPRWTTRPTASVSRSATSASPVPSPPIRALPSDRQVQRHQLQAGLELNGLTDKSYEADLRSTIARTVLQAAVVGGVAPADA